MSYNADETVLVMLVVMTYSAGLKANKIGGYPGCTRAYSILPEESKFLKIVHEKASPTKFSDKQCI